MVLNLGPNTFTSASMKVTIIMETVGGRYSSKMEIVASGGDRTEMQEFEGQKITEKGGRYYGMTYR